MVKRSVVTRTSLNHVGSRVLRCRATPVGQAAVNFSLKRRKPRDSRRCRIREREWPRCLQSVVPVDDLGRIDLATGHTVGLPALVNGIQPLSFDLIESHNDLAAQLERDLFRCAEQLHLPFTLATGGRFEGPRLVIDTRVQHT